MIPKQFSNSCLAFRVRIMALSQLRQLEAEAAEKPQDFRRGTQQSCEAMYERIDGLPEDALCSFVSALRKKYEAVGMAEAFYLSDALLLQALIDYQNSIGAYDPYDAGFDKDIEGYFHTIFA